MKDHLCFQSLQRYLQLHSVDSLILGIYYNDYRLVHQQHKLGFLINHCLVNEFYIHLKDIDDCCDKWRCNGCRQFIDFTSTYEKKDNIPIERILIEKKKLPHDILSQFYGGDLIFKGIMYHERLVIAVNGETTFEGNGDELIENIMHTNKKKRIFLCTVSMVDALKFEIIRCCYTYYLNIEIVSNIAFETEYSRYLLQDIDCLNKKIKIYSKAGKFEQDIHDFINSYEYSTHENYMCRLNCVNNSQTVSRDTIYQILCSSQLASETEVKRAYRILSLRYHPDKYFGDKTIFQIISHIHDLYKDMIDKD